MWKLWYSVLAIECGRNRNTRKVPGGLFLALVASLCLTLGCWAPKSQVATLQTQNESLTDKVHALETMVENLELHSDNTENQLIETERALVDMERQSGGDRRQLVNLQSERDYLHQQFPSGADSGWGVSPTVRQRLETLSESFGGLDFDPRLGVSKLDVDILFDQGEDQLKPGADEVLGKLVHALKSQEGNDLRVLVVGHTDDQLLAARPVRDKYGDNFRLSTARAHAVGERLRLLGMESERVGIAGYGPHQPVASNGSEVDRMKNRRVELFVMAPNVPVIGWTESVSHLY